MQLKARIKRLEERAGIGRKELPVIFLIRHYFCTFFREKKNIYQDCHLAIGNPENKRDCKTCEHRDTCGQGKPERFKMLWDKHMQGPECEACIKEMKQANPNSCGDYCGIIEWEEKRQADKDKPQ